MNMPSLFVFVQKGVYIEIFAITLILVGYFFIRFWLLMQCKIRLKQKKRLEIYLKEANIFSADKRNPLSPKHLHFFKHHMVLFLEYLLT